MSIALMTRPKICSHSQGNPATSDGRVANTDILRQEQLNDESLKTAWNAAAKGKAGYTVENGLLYHTEKIVSIGEKCQQLCLPEQRRKAVLELAHCIRSGAIRRIDAPGTAFVCHFFGRH